MLYEGLRRHSGLDDTALEFWAVHVAAGEAHGDNGVRALELCGQRLEQQARSRRACRFGVLAHAGMTEGCDRFR